MGLQLGEMQSIWVVGLDISWQIRAVQSEDDRQNTNEAGFIFLCYNGPICKFAHSNDLSGQQELQDRIIMSVSPENI